MKLKNNIISTIDVGTSKIICLIAAIDGNDNLKVIGYGHQSSEGFRAGGITDIKLAESSLIRTIEEAEKMAGVNIDRVIISINNCKSEAHHQEVSLNLTGNPITDRDIAKLINQALDHYSTQNQEVINYFPLEYSIDNENNIKDPRLMFGSILGCKLHIITANSNILLNLANCLARCHIDVGDFVLSSYASSLAALTKDEINLGSILIDIGASSSNISVFFEGNMIASGSIALGGSHITSDIAHGLSLSLIDAERLKVLHGSAARNLINECEVVDLYIPGESEISYIKLKELNDIIRPRAEEILELVRDYIIKAKIDRLLIKKIVLTGGTSELNGIKDLAENIFDKTSRIALPKILNGLNSIKVNTSFSTVIGSLIYAHNKMLKEKYKTIDKEFKKPGIISKLFGWL